MKSAGFKYLLAAILLANFGLLAVAQARPDGLTHFYFFDVGQGDASLVRTADNHFILIDGGPDDTIISQLDRVIPMWHRKLDLVILTHAHADHATGLLAVLDQYSVNQFWYSGADYDSATYRALLAKVTARQVPIRLASQGDAATVGQTNLRVLFPLVENPTAKDPNEASIISTVQYKNFSALFLGDATTSNTNTIDQLLSDVDVLKVPHHGSRTASSVEFISRTQPEIGVIMVGANNPFGHPHPEIVERYQAAGTRLYRTDQDGTVEIVTDGDHYKVR